MEKLTFKQAVQIRNTPEFKAIEATIAAKCDELRKLEREIAEKFPLQDDYYWQLQGYDKIRVFPAYSGSVEETE